jgi:hypothetical protein
VMAPGDGAGTGIPADVIHTLMKGRHRVSRYGAEVNVP